ncbi:hypothetical protein [Amycolatopsis balhimycina]|nr:hypothetical protein [Amycolatopsis balhimycina]
MSPPVGGREFLLGQPVREGQDKGSVGGQRQQGVAVGVVQEVRGA